MEIKIEIIISIIATIFWFYQFFKKQKQNIELEKIKKELEIYKEKNILNDNTIRKAYEDFISLMFKILNKENKKLNINLEISKFLEKTIIFSWPKTIKAFWNYRKNANDNENILYNIEKLLFSIREDLWVSNEWLEKFDILQTFIIEDLKKIETQKIEKIKDKES